MEAITLKNEQISVSITNLGATITSIHTRDRNGVMKNVVAGFSDLQQYENNEAYFGCIVGRYANRITGGRFTLGAETIQLSLNDGANHLHGGFEGFHKKVWTIVSVNDQKVILEYLSKDGEEGYPGNLRVRVTYILDGRALRIQYHAVTDKPTPVNLTNHSYFNLSGFEYPVITDHLLWINADHYTSNNADNLPDGHIREVADTPLDFRVPTRIGGDLNHNYVLKTGPAARLYDPLTGRQLEVFTDQPGIQVYTAYLWDGNPYAKHGAVALETQAFPDSPNHPAFPTTILYPGDVYERYTVYVFSLTA
jgi:aldose 1-epimerase